MEKNLIFVLVLYDSQRRSFIDFVTTSAQVMCDYIKDMTERQMHDGYDSSIEVWEDSITNVRECFYLDGHDETSIKNYHTFQEKYVSEVLS